MNEFNYQSIERKGVLVQNNAMDGAGHVQVEEILDLLAAMMRKIQPVNPDRLSTNAQGDEELNLVVSKNDFYSNHQTGES